MLRVERERTSRQRHNHPSEADGCAGIVSVQQPTGLLRFQPEGEKRQKRAEKKRDTEKRGGNGLPFATLGKKPDRFARALRQPGRQP